MTVEEFKDLFEKEIAYPVENESQNHCEVLDWFLYNISDEEAILGKHHFACVKIREQLMSRKLMTVKSEFVFIERETKMPAAFTVGVQSTVDSLDADHMEYTNCMNYTLRESSKEDLAMIYSVMQFKAEHPHIGNLLSFSYRFENMTQQEKIKYRRGLIDSCPMEEVGELAIAV